MPEKRETRSFTARLAVNVLERLENEGRRSGQSNARVAERLIDEGLRMAEFPGLVFRPGPMGRRASLVDGPDVWEVVRELRRANAEGVPDPVASCARGLGLTPEQVECAAGYYGAYPDDVGAAGYYGAYPDDVDERLQAEEIAAERLRRTLAGSA